MHILGQYYLDSDSFSDSFIHASELSKSLNLLLKSGYETHIPILIRVALDSGFKYN